MTFRGNWAWMALVTLALSACVSAPPRPVVDDPDAAWQQRANDLYNIGGWEVKAKLAVKTHKRGGQATMLWHRDRDVHNINLYGPLGSGRVILTRDQAGATLRDNKKRTYHAGTAEELLYRVAGWQVPFQSMRYWLLGVPRPDEEYELSVDEWGRLQTLRQSGWEVEFQEYKEYEGRELPRRFNMTALPGRVHIADDQLDENDQVRVRVLIKLWLELRIDSQ
jgi:outer membrane lipoprotein LolB